MNNGHACMCVCVSMQAEEGCVMEGDGLSQQQWLRQRLLLASLALGSLLLLVARVGTLDR